MKHTLRAIIFAVAGFLTTNAGAATKKFGEAITLKEAISLKAAVASYKSIKDKDVLISGTIGKVCQKKGCWLVIKTDMDDVRVGFKDYSFFIPMDAAGQPVRMQGRLEYKQLSIKQQQHFLKDAGASEEQISAVKEPKMAYSFTAAGLEIDRPQ